MLAGKPLFILNQLAPLLVERNVPLAVPAKTLSSLTVIGETRVSVKPLLTFDQAEPLLVERKTPDSPLPRPAPAKI